VRSPHGRTPSAAAGVSVRPLREADLDTADHIMRTAFGTYLRAPDPVRVFGDSDKVHTRFATAPECAFAAELDGEVVGSNFATRWGSFGFFGPLTVRVDLWDRGIGVRLMEPVMALFEEWGVRLAALFTFPESVKHVGLYQKFGFWPQRLTPVMSKAVAAAPAQVECSTYSSLSGEGEREDALRASRELTGAIFDGLDLEREILAVERQRLGETVLVHEGSELAALAVCHCGPDTEAGSGVCFVKFGAARPGPEAADRFERLLDACERLAAERGLGRLVAGVSTARRDAYRRLIARGYRAFLHGLSMHRPDEPGYNRPDVYVMDDLR
jgi:predicted N-acetyltransferase YhbS